MESKRLTYIQNRFRNPFYISTPLGDRGLSAIGEHGRRFPFRKCIDFTFYQPRDIQRYLVLQNHFLGYLNGRVLDVGSRHNTIQELLKKDCELIDKNNPNLEPFDWEKHELPYLSRSFDAVVCMDTLEHINDLHFAFQDLLRVSKKYVIISLPNCWKKTFKVFLKGGGGSTSYGIPPEKPFDRHKWFFNPQDMEDFLAYQSVMSPMPFEIVDVIFHIPQTRWWHPVIKILSYLFPGRYYKNLFTETTFAVLEKRGE